MDRQVRAEKHRKAHYFRELGGIIAVHGFFFMAIPRKGDGMDSAIISACVPPVIGSGRVPRDAA
jgi:hypothetical protein